MRAELVEAPFDRLRAHHAARFSTPQLRARLRMHLSARRAVVIPLGWALARVELGGGRYQRG